eukprot:TRINITY_DN16790_c0_g1_i1.p3 TRINITY_DN16790_c0_g1~~TRINITY_DN16790_c0_g1_i1.p3  ORF type:complete len:142 (+),score=28.67 TRINITY_DN16790_c0_g1_i1:128-553(+)
MGLASALASVCCFLLRLAVALICTVASAGGTAFVVVVLNDDNYGQPWHYAFAQAFVPLPPAVSSGLLLTLPPLAAALCATSRCNGGKAGRCGCCRPIVRAALAGLVGGVLVGLLASNRPGPYGNGVRDADILSNRSAKDEI